MQVAFVFALLLCATAQAAMVGSNKCTWGPSYWCSNENAANECGAMEYCTSKGLLTAPVTEAKPSPVECKLCHLAVDKVVKNLTSNSTVAEIEEALSKVCAKMGGFAAVCEDFVEKFTPELVALLAQDLNATAVCIKLDFCNSTAVAANIAPVNGAVSGEPKPVQCALCKLTISKIEKDISSNSTFDNITKKLYQLCAEFGAFVKPCEDLVDHYLPELIALLVKGLNATAICNAIQVCNDTLATTAPATLDDLPLAVAETLTFGGNIGSQACTQGPSYWCTSLDKATMCDAVSYCTKTAWATTGVPK